LQTALSAGTSQTAVSAESAISTTNLAKPSLQSLLPTSLAFGLSPHVAKQGLQDGSNDIEDDTVLRTVLPPKLLELVRAMQHALSTIRLVSESADGLTRRYKTGLL